jgi:hypothetical protein
MNFLQSVIADARPCKSMPEHSDSSLATTGWKTPGLDGAATATEALPSGAVEQTRHSSVSLPIRDRASEFIVGDTPALIQVRNPANQDGPGMKSNVEPESSISVPSDMSRPTPDEESYPYTDIGNFSDRDSGSEGSNSSKVEGGLTTQSAGTFVKEGRTNSPTSQANDFSNAFPESQSPQNRASGSEESEPVSSPPAIDETPATQTDVLQTTTLISPESGRPTESSVLERSLVPSVSSPDAFGNPMPDNSAGRNEEQIALADVGKTGQVLQGVSKLADMKRLSSQEKTPQLQKTEETKGNYRDVQLVSRQVMVMDSPISSDIEHAPIPQSAGKKVSASSSIPDPSVTNLGNFEQQVVGPAKSSASSEAFRAAPARPFQTDSMTGAGGTFYSRSPSWSPEKANDIPKVQIGQIDIIIEAAAQSAPKSVAAPAQIDLASRLYLRRL